MNPKNLIPLIYGDGIVMATVAPWRGGLVASLVVHGKELLAMDQETLNDPESSIRGGIPVLFPFCGRLENDTLNLTGTQIPMHGFARNREWDAEPLGESSLLMSLPTDAEIQEIYPWPFRLSQRITLIERGIHIELLAENGSDKPMPVAPGWHPYFVCPAAKKGEVGGSFSGTEPGCLYDDGQPNFGLVPPPNGRTRFQLPDTGMIGLEFAPEMRHLQLWSLPGKDFVCLEPFAGPPNVLNTDRAEFVAPHTARTWWMRIELLT